MPVRWIIPLAACVLFASALPSPAQVPAESRQLILGISSCWQDSHVLLRRYERVGHGWRQVGDQWQGRLGRNGSVWGRGIHPIPQGAQTKHEGDGRAPAGVFDLGGAYGFHPPASIRRHPGLPYHQVTSRDLWVEDASSPLYNRHVRLPHHEPRTEWERKQQMKQRDPAHALKLFIRHNTDPEILAGAGSAIFFHIWRENGGRPTAGCTTMAEPRLRDLIAWINPEQRPVFVLLPQPEYTRLARAWHLP